MPATALEQLQLEFVNEARLDSMWPSDQTRKVTGELVLAGDYHQFGLIHKACIRGGRIPFRTRRFGSVDQRLSVSESAGRQS